MRSRICLANLLSALVFHLLFYFKYFTIGYNRLGKFAKYDSSSSFNMKNFHHVSRLLSNIKPISRDFNINEFIYDPELINKSSSLSDNKDSNDSLSYDYIDSGNFMRLERFGKLTVCRSCPSAYWIPRLNENVWKEKTDVQYEGVSGKHGKWIITDNNNNNNNNNNKRLDNTNNVLNSEWLVKFNSVIFNLSCSDMGQVGVFPEQKENWQWIQNKLQIFKSKTLNVRSDNLTVLNCFAYTGGSSIAALSSKASVQTAIKNVELSKFSDRPIRWIIEDCMTFIRREIRRRELNSDDNNNKGVYDGLIFDPPAFGRSGKKIWKLEYDFPILLETIPKLLSDDPAFILLTCHDKNWDANKLYDSLKTILSPLQLGGKYEKGIMSVDSNLSKLPLGCYVRWSKY